MEKFQVGLSSDFIMDDGTPAFPSFDLSELDANNRIDWRFVALKDGRMDASDIKGLDALILLGARFDADSFPGDDQLSLIARFGVGYDTVDVDACTRNNTALTITPNGVRRPVAVAILTFILALSGKLLQKDRATRNGPPGWSTKAGLMGEGLIGRTLGSLGAGNIGAEMFRLAKTLGLNFIAHDPFADKNVAKDLGVELVSMSDLFTRSDFLAINCPLNENTKSLVNAERLAMMKPGSYLINTARGPIVDQQALYNALVSGHLGGAGLDVFEEEPASASEPLFTLDNVIVTPHALCWTDQCFAGIGADDIKAVMSVMAGEKPLGIVNNAILNNSRWLEKLKRYGLAALPSA